MNATDIITGVGSVLNLITKFLPLVGVKDAGAIGEIVKTLTDIAPLVTSQIGTTYTGVKNIIDAVGDHPAATKDQLASLTAFNKQVDDAWDKVEAELDPDRPGNI